MKYVLAVICGALLASVPAWAGAVQGNQTPRTRQPVSVAVTTANVNESFDLRSDTLLLWNRDERSTPIGHAVLTCAKVGSGGILGGGVANCEMSISLPLGKVIASGISHGYNRFTMVITGGSGRYTSASGPLFVRRIAGGVRRMTFSI